ncbi:hypothetical protein OPFLODJI_03093 [Aeromonas hydrophila]
MITNMQAPTQMPQGEKRLSWVPGIDPDWSLGLPKKQGHTIGMPLVIVPLQPAQALSCAIGDHHCLLAASSRKDQARTRLILLPWAISSTRT